MKTGADRKKLALLGVLGLLRLVRTRVAVAPERMAFALMEHYFLLR